MKVNSDHRSKFSNLSNWKEEAWKKSGLQAILLIKDEELLIKDEENPWTDSNKGIK